MNYFSLSYLHLLNYTCSICSTHSLRPSIGLLLLITLTLSACGGDSGSPCEGSLQGLNESCGKAQDDGSITISGTILISENSLLDSDVNDPSEIYQSNDDFSRAQALRNPGTLGGHLNMAQQGDSNGRTYISGDISDFYEVALRANQKLYLSIADNSTSNQQGGSNPNDLDLYLYNVSQQEVDNSLGSGFTESVTAITEGVYFVEVRIESGSTNYLLTTSSTANSLQTSTGLNNQNVIQTLRTDRLSTYDHFNPGEILVQYKDTVSPQNSQNFQVLSVDSRGLSDITPSRRQQRKLKLQTSSSTTLHINSKIEKRTGNKDTDNKISEINRLKKRTIDAIKALRKREDVEYAEPNYIYQISAEPNDAFYPRQWHYSLINLPAAWDITTGSEDVIVAVIDTGILSSHPDISPNLMKGYDFISDPAISQDGDGIDSNPEDPGDRTDSVSNSSFHGTHVAGTIASVGNNAIGISGVTWNTKIMPLRALGAGGGYADDIAQAILYAAGLENDSGKKPSQQADIINMSLGGLDKSSPVTDAISLARAAGVTIVAASGNTGTNQPSYPAATEGVISVGAVDLQKKVTGYSSFGSTIDVVAPGGDLSRDRDGDSNSDGILSLLGEHKNSFIQNTYGYYQGTSMAAPHVAGVIALMKSQKPLTPDQIDNLLSSGELTDDLGSTGRDDSYGHGLINAFKAVVAAQGQFIADQSPNLRVFPPTIDLGSINVTSFFYAINSGGGDLGISSVLTNPADSWLTVSPPSEGDLGSYSLLIDRTDLEENLYATTVTVVASNGDIEIITVQMQVSDSQLPTNAGQHYVLLVDPKISEIKGVAELSVTAENGQYHFSFNNVDPSEYVIIAGSDRNSDNTICGDKSLEACGKYPTYSKPELISIDKSTDNLNFSTSYRNTLTTTSLSVPQRSNTSQSDTNTLLFSLPPEGYSVNATSNDKHTQ